LVTRSDRLPGLFDTWVDRQTRSLTIPIHFLSDFLEVAEKDSRIFDVAVRASSFGIGVDIACHTPLAVQVLALERRLDLTAHEVDAYAVAIIVTVVVVVVVSTEVRGFGADFVAYVLVEDCVAGWGDFGREGGVGELRGELGGDLDGYLVVEYLLVVLF